MTNPMLPKLGFKAHDRVVIIHADDVGMCHAANVAFWKDQAFGIPTSGSVMMPCPWVSEMAAWCRQHPQADVGVHITLTSEWKKQGYRWRPLSTVDPKSGLIDEEGYMWPSISELHAHMDADAAIAEMRAQIELALALGIDVTHIDTHMGGVAHPLLVPAYIQLAVEYRIPAMVPRRAEQLDLLEQVAPTAVQAMRAALGHLETSGFPVLDYTCDVPYSGDRFQDYARLFDSVPVGITHVQTHPSAPGYDVEVITNSAPERIADYQVFQSSELQSYAAEQGVHLIGYRALRDLIQSGA
jgi:predicted glycoside hydrolase/deacetylase ChbG (UPF0249 family)